MGGWGQDKTIRMGVRAWAEPTPCRVARPASTAHPLVSCCPGLPRPHNCPAEDPGVSQVLCIAMPAFPRLSVLWGSKGTGGFQSYVTSLPIICSPRMAQPCQPERLPAESPSAAFPERLLPCTPAWPGLALPRPCLCQSIPGSSRPWEVKAHPQPPPPLVLICSSFWGHRGCCTRRPPRALPVPVSWNSPHGPQPWAEASSPSRRATLVLLVLGSRAPSPAEAAPSPHAVVGLPGAGLRSPKVPQRKAGPARPCSPPPPTGSPGLDPTAGGVGTDAQANIRRRTSQLSQEVTPGRRGGCPQSPGSGSGGAGYAHCGSRVQPGHTGDTAGGQTSQVERWQPWE